MIADVLPEKNMEKLTKVQTLKKIYNQMLEAACRNEIDASYYIAKANHFGKKKPEYKVAMENSKAQEAVLFWKKMTLKIIEGLIEKYENLEKTNGGAENKA